MQKVLLATPHMPPTPGGPSIHAKKLAEHFKFTLFNFEKYKKFPTGLRHIFAFIEIFLKSFGKEKILVLDAFTVALPSIFVGKLLNKEIILRVGGDFVYEQFLYTKEVDFESFYKNFHEYKKVFPKKMYIKYLIQKFVLQNAGKIIFNTEWQKNIFAKHYNLKRENIFVIENPVEEIDKNIFENEKYENNSKYIFTSITRGIPYKNQNRVKLAFKNLQQKQSDKEIYFEDKKGSWENCLKKISVSRAYICASISDIAPNQVLEAVSLKIPIILTKYSGFTNIFEQAGIAKIVNPFSVEEIENAILEMCDEEKYKFYKNNLQKFSWPQNWNSLYAQYEKILQK